MNPWIKVGYVTPPLDEDLICLLSTGKQAVCYFYDNRFTFSNNEHWGFDVIAWKHLEKQEDILKELERGY